MALDTFHPVIQDWFRSRFDGPTEPQTHGWPPIAAGQHTLIAAPTGSGKTLTAFLAVIDRLFREAVEGRLADEMRVVYVSPLRALSNDMHRNLETPLVEILAEAERQGFIVSPIRVGLRTGDTPSHQRAALVRRPPHIFVTTPESLFLMLTAEKSREALRTVDTLIVDEIHALVRDKRGSHLSLSMERLQHVTERPLQRIGISATQKPIERTAAFLVGGTNAECPPSKPTGDAPWVPNDHTPPPPYPRGVARGLEKAHSTHPSPLTPPPITIVDVGHQRDLDLGIEVPASELSSVCSHEQWAEVNTRLVESINDHRSTLIFVNTRRLAERLTFQLTERLGEDTVGAHHGSLAADIRLATEQRLKSGRLKAVVATASLELGIDVGYIDLVVQMGSPRSIATFLQRIGRSGHALGLTPKGRLFALTRDELIECMALVRAVKAGRLDVTPIPEGPLDILAQQLVAEVAAEDWDTDELYDLCRRAHSYRNLAREHFDEVVQFLSEGLTDKMGRMRTYLHHDRVNRRLRARKGARITAVNNAGAIPEVDAVRVVMEPEMTVVGSVDEDFAVEGQAGDIFLLGNTSWRMHGLRGNDLIVSDAHGAPPTIPFWRGEAPGRTVELSEEVSRTRDEVCSVAGAAVSMEESGVFASVLYNELEDSGDHASYEPAVDWLAAETNCSEHAARQAVEYVVAQKAAVDVVPTQARVVFERFFDESGGMQLVVHAPFGGRINRAWGLAMRKRFCRSFDFELQASADDEGFILSLGPQHSFPIESLFPMLRADNVRNLLVQALLAVPLFHMRWRWNVTRALMVDRRRNGKKVAPALQRFRAEDLLTAVFPQLTGCQEERTGDFEIPDHPLVRQTVEDCLTEALDLEGLIEILERVQRGEITFVARDTREPSPFAYELLNANPYAFLDGGEIQERRARAVATRRSVSVESVQDLGHLNPEAIGQVVREAQPLVRNADELHDVLLSRLWLPLPESSDSGAACGFAADTENAAKPQAFADAVEWGDHLATLVADRRATTVTLADGRRGWAAAERLPAVQTMFPEAICDPPLDVPGGVRDDWTAVRARVAAVRGLMELAGPVTAAVAAAQTGITVEQAAAALEALEGEGLVMRGHFTPEGRAAQSGALEWCHRRLLARIHRLTVAGLRREIEPVDVTTFLRFLARHQGVHPDSRKHGANGLYEVIGQLQGLDVPAVAWEGEIFRTRVVDYQSAWLDELCLTGEVGWGRLYPPARDPDKSRPMAAITRIAPVSIYLREDSPWLLETAAAVEPETLSSPAQEVLALLRQRGAMFAADLMNATRLLPAQIDDVLGELVVRGFATSDGFTGLRKIARADGAKPTPSRARRSSRSVTRRRSASGTGRWSVWRGDGVEPTPDDTSDRERRREVVEQWAWQLLRRWGVVFRDLLQKESGPPPWWELLQVYRRLEARGEIRGGRFVHGVAGEQFALSDTIGELRRLRDHGSPDRAEDAELLVLSAVDPLNLVGVLTDHPRVASRTSNSVVLLDGQPVAAVESGEITVFNDCPAHFRPAVLARCEATLKETGSDDRQDSTEADDRHARRFERRRRPADPSPPSGIPRPTIS